MKTFRIPGAATVGWMLCASAWPALGAAPFDYGAFLGSIRLQPEFKVTLAAGEPAIRFPMFACFDDAGRLYVAESSGKDLYAGLNKLTRDCRVSRLEDSDGDGRFEKATVFQEGVTFPMGLAWHEGRLYLADPPNLIALTDTDADGRADRREVILSGFGHTDNGSLHGLTFGPDGLLYFTMGEPDGWKLPRGNGTLLEGVAGALFRSRPDGSRPEVISRGFENLVEIEFMPGGEFIGTDNWYQVPAGGYRDALIDCAPGGLYPYAADRGTPLPRTGVTLPPLILLPAVAHSGLTRIRTTGFPPEWRNSLFVAEHNTRKVTRHELRRNGSTFASTHVDFASADHPDFHPSDVLEDADGSLLIVDTGGWYVEHCPTGRIRDSRAPGGIYRVRWNEAATIPDPWGRSLPWAKASAAELAGRLRDHRPVVAHRAAGELVRRRESAPLIAALDSGESIDTRLRALWSLARLPGAESLRTLRSQLTTLDSTLVCAAARVLAFRGDRASGNDLARLLDSTNAPVRRAAAESLANGGSRSHAPALVEALARAQDDFEQHACITALLALADEPFVRGLLKQESARVRHAALHLLDQAPFASLRFADLLAPLGENDPNLRAAAQRLLERHPDWAGDALPWLRQQVFVRPAESSQVAALFIAFQADARVRKLISELLDPATTTPDATRAFLLNLLPSLSARRPEAAWLQAIPPALTNRALRPAALSAAMAYRQPEWATMLTTISEDSSVPAAERFLAARISARQPALEEGLFTLALSALGSQANPADRLGATDLLARARLSPAQVRLLVAIWQRGVPVALEAMLPALARAADEETGPLLAEFFNTRLTSGWSPARATLDRALAIFPDDPATRAALTGAWEQNNATMLRRLTEFKPLLAGGDPKRGREWFNTATCAGCHRIGERGGVVGPDLTRVGAIRSGGDLLESILYPSSSFAQGYEPYLLTRRDGEELSGSLVAQGPESVSVRDGIGVIHRVRSDDVGSLRRQQLSAMPEGLEQWLTREQFRDLLAYLQSLK
jgi:putative membrane-bound dehydrogenase-like protein